jgi:hypothetical protein
MKRRVKKPDPAERATKAAKRDPSAFTDEDRAALREVREAIARGESDKALSQAQITALLRERSRRAG